MIDRTRVLKPAEDAFGRALSAFYKGEDAYEIVERDDGYIDAMSLKGYFTEYKDWPIFEKQAVDLAGGKVLDIGCGAGRHALHLQRRGLDVLGIDISPLAVDLCKRRGLKNVKPMSIDDLHRLKQGLFNTVLMMGNNFGLFASLQKARQLLRKLYRITAGSALIISLTRDPYRTQNPAHLEYHTRNKKKGRMGGQVRIRIRYEKLATRWFEYLMVSKAEMKQILDGTRWKIREIREPGGRRSSHYVAVIEKT